MKTVKLTISYDGTAYKGWQLQNNGNTVQAEVEKAILKVFGKHHRISAASRTDSGVHARAQAAHFKTLTAVPEEKIAIALNSVLPSDISVTGASFVKDGFHARFDAKKKHYRYTIHNSRTKDPFRNRYSWQIPYALDLAIMRKESKELLGEHDFKAFQARDKKERTSVRKISRISVKKEGALVVIDIEANGFLYNMVRNIVGTLVDIGRGYLSEGSMRSILKSRDRTKAGPTAPARGLSLIAVKY